MCVRFLASKKKTEEKLKSSSVDAAADLDFSSEPLTEGMGKPLRGRPLNEEMIVMEGNANIPPSLAVDRTDAHPAETDGTDSSNTKRDDL